ncbi:NTF2 fold immunity protein [Chryseobacterium sp. MP_3.2]|uniref:NTF2 fold immunity protein n=1 Tax=Chryseobacterium sp. MP_3.2 TaxID=3071712 RepID=UPI002E0C6FB1|nr:hypothetical protein [Chryseobacterium sp. MP_3.2]
MIPIITITLRMRLTISFLLLIISCGKSEKLNSNKILTDEELAIQIAEKKWREVYGKKAMAEEQPLKAKKINDSIYFVEATFSSTGFGGVAFGEVDIKNKVVLNYSHGK